jgi:predicted DNA-binding transcriptional regulator YafY
MPSSDSGTTLARQWELLNNIIPYRRPGKSTSQMRNELERAGFRLHKRTVERDMNELSRLFPIECNDKGRPHGWYWSENGHFDVPCMELSEAVSLGLMEDVLRQIMPKTFLAALEGRFARARKKLEALPGLRHAHWKNLVRYQPPGMPFLPPVVRPEVLSAIQIALLEQKQLLVDYRSVGQSEDKNYFLHPLSLIQQGVRAYLVATRENQDLPRLYAIHRMQKAELSHQPSRMPKGYSLDSFIASGSTQFDPGKMITLKAKVSPYLAHVLEETPLSQDQKITSRAGSHTLTATVQNSWELDFWLRSQGTALTVLQPAALRKKTIAELKLHLSQYESI